MFRHFPFLLAILALATSCSSAPSFRAADLSDDESAVATVNEQGVIQLWEVKSEELKPLGKLRHPAQKKHAKLGPNQIKFSPKGKVLGCYWGNGLALWDVNTRRPLYFWQLPGVGSFDFYWGENLLAVGGFVGDDHLVFKIYRYKGRTIRLVDEVKYGSNQSRCTLLRFLGPKKIGVVVDKEFAILSLNPVDATKDEKKKAPEKKKPQPTKRPVVTAKKIKEKKKKKPTGIFGAAPSAAIGKKKTSDKKPPPAKQPQPKPKPVKKAEPPSYVRPKAVVFDIHGTALSPAAKLLARPSLGKVFLYSYLTGRHERTLVTSDEDEALIQVSFSPDGSALFAMSTTGHIYAWEVNTNDLILTRSLPDDAWIGRNEMYGVSQPGPSGERFIVTARGDVLVVWNLQGMTPFSSN